MYETNTLSFCLYFTTSIKINFFILLLLLLYYTLFYFNFPLSLFLVQYIVFIIAIFSVYIEY